MDKIRSNSLSLKYGRVLDRNDINLSLKIFFSKLLAQVAVWEYSNFLFGEKSSISIYSLTNVDKVTCLISDGYLSCQSLRRLQRRTFTHYEHVHMIIKTTKHAFGGLKFNWNRRLYVWRASFYYNVVSVLLSLGNILLK